MLCALRKPFDLSVNIFLLDKNHDRNARMHCDQHVVKMILESAQILSTVLHSRGVNAPYRATHCNHPCVLWTGASYENFQWLIQLARALHEEYQFRFGSHRFHASMHVVDFADEFSFESHGLTPFAQCVPEAYRFKGNPVRAYRAYYRNEKLSFARWTKREIPKCFKSSASERRKIAN